MNQVQDLALGVVEPQEVHTVPPLKPAQIPLDGIHSPFFVMLAQYRIIEPQNILRWKGSTRIIESNSWLPAVITNLALGILPVLDCPVGYITVTHTGSGLLVAAQDATEDEEAVEDTVVEDEDDEAEVEEDEPTDLTEEKEEEDLSGEPKASPSADTTILFVKGEDFPANNIVKFLVGFTNKGTEDFIVESLDASFRYPQDYQFYIQNFTALPLNTVVPPQRQATFEYSFIPAEPMGGRPFGLVINLNYRDVNGNMFQDAVFNQTVTIIEKEDGLDGETIFMYMFLAGLGLLVIVGLHQLLESRKRKRPVQKVEMGTSNQNDVDMSWIPQETLNQINKASPRRLPRKRAQKRSVGSDE
uniref:Translocon-associated protein subunit alpha n=1 Tax=Anas platyrhynchos platyrhynchos TaxID=8840 RepID=A0A493T618_ANAPP